MNKKIIIILLLSLLGIVQFSSSQVFISKTATAFRNIVNSPYLGTRLSYDTAFQKMSGFGITDLNTSKFAGEYFLYNDMVINVVVITQRDAFFFKPLTEVQQWYRDMAWGGDDRPLEEYYYDKIKNYLGFKAYTSYFKTSDMKRFILQDNLGRYAIMGRIYHSLDDVGKAEAFVGTLLNSITFK